MTYYLKTIATGIANIQQGRTKIGSVRASKEQPGKFVAAVDGDKVYGSSMSEAFSLMCARLNRIALCGADDKDAARAVLVERNEAVRKEAAEFNSLMGYAAVRVRNTRVHI